MRIRLARKGYIDIIAIMVFQAAICTTKTLILS